MLNFVSLAATLAPLFTLRLTCPVMEVLFPQDSTNLDLVGPLQVNEGDLLGCSVDNDGYQLNSSAPKLYAPEKSPMIQSNTTMQRFYDYFEERQGAALSIELWVTPVVVTKSSYDILPILTIGRQEALPKTIRPRNRCHDYDFQLSQLGPYLQVSFTTSRNTCKTSLIPRPQLVDGALTHVVITLGRDDTRVYFDGRVSRPLTDIVDMQANWNGTYGLQLLSDHVPPVFDTANSKLRRVFDGVLHVVQLYDKVLTEENVDVLYQRGFNGGASAENSDDLVELNQNSTAVATSEPEKGTVEVMNVYVAPTLSVPTEARLKMARGFPEYIIAGIDFDNSKNHNVDRVRVDVQVAFETGQVTLSRPDLADFASCSTRIGDWKCRGNGTGRYLTFVGDPGDVTTILADLTFRPFVNKGEADQIIIRVYDGSGGECLSPEEHKDQSNPSFHPRCTLSQGIVLILPPHESRTVSGEQYQGASEKDDTHFLDKTLDAAVAWLANSWMADHIIFLSVVALYAANMVVVYFRIRRGRRGLEETKAPNAREKEPVELPV